MITSCSDSWTTSRFDHRLIEGTSTECALGCSEPGTQLSTMVGSGARWALWNVSMTVVLWSSFTMQLNLQVGAVPAQAPEHSSEASRCTLNNAYRLWNDRSSCKVLLDLNQSSCKLLDSNLESFGTHCGFVLLEIALSSFRITTLRD